VESVYWNSEQQQKIEPHQRKRHRW